MIGYRGKVGAWWLVALVALPLVACNAVTERDARGAGERSPSASPDRAPLPRERVQTELAVPGQPDWLAVAYGSVWVARDEAGAVDRIAPDTNEVIATVPVGGHPCNGMAAGFASIWVPSCSDDALYRIAAETGTVEATIELPVYQSVKGVAPSGGLAAGHGAVWIVTQGRAGRFDTLAQIDPRRNQVVRRILLGHVGGRVAVDESSIWVTAPTAGSLLRVDPGSGRVVEIEGLVQPTAVATGLGAVWVLSATWSDHPDGDGSVTRVDPATNRIVTRIRIEEMPGTPGALTTGAGFLWARTSTTALAKLDPRTNRLVTAHRNDKGNGDLAYGFNALWLSDFALNTVRRVSP